MDSIAPTAPSRTTLTLVQPCQPFCRTHDDNAGVCIGDTITLDFSAPGRPDIMAVAAHLTLTHDLATGTDLDVNVGLGSMTLDDADRLAHAILAVTAHARLTGGAR